MSAPATIPNIPNIIRSPPKEFKEDGGLLEDQNAVKDFTQSETRSLKRRKLSHDDSDNHLSNNKKKPNCAPEEQQRTERETKPEPTDLKPTQKKQTRRKGPFLLESDSENDDEDGDEVLSSPLICNANTEETATTLLDKNEKKVDSSETVMIPICLTDEGRPEIPNVPPLKQGESVYEEFKNLEDMEELFDDAEEFDDGEENRERRYMEEQARLEAEEAGNYISDGIPDEPRETEGIVESCPLCNVSLAGITSEQATVHVNACLDGNPIPLPKSEASQPPLPPPPPRKQDTVDSPEVSKRFAKAAIPRPGQANPITLGATVGQPTSAFSKLMSGHAEDAAWASAAASENASRGKPAYKRTCPFYKIMPGFSICVDAFRYGAVQGCNAYFLSHFHSDHYTGLTANWSHGPIYCSKVTGSLVKKQLRTAAKWVKELEFEDTVEIPGTEGATVTMLPANHCPGSSLFLFEKSFWRGQNKTKQRILHCGDFRACPAQVTHSLLKPDSIDAISGKIKQQKIDVCYLDTTYLNPRYSFPPQDDVITACAEFCKSISDETSDADELLGMVAREKGSVTKFFKKENSSSAVVKSEGAPTPKEQKGRLLVICGTYSIGKERICKAIAQALGTKIFASAHKIKIIAQLEDPELAALMTSDPLEAQVHMQMLMEIRADTLQDYLDSYKPHFSRIVGFRPSGWSYRPTSTSSKSLPANTSPSSTPTTSILHGTSWRPRFTTKDLVVQRQRGSTRRAMCFGVPYSEHSSFRELALFVMALRIEKVVPTVNVGSEASRVRMKGWLDRWVAERRRGGVVGVVVEGDEGEGGKGGGEGERRLWDGKDGRGGAVLW